MNHLRASAVPVVTTKEGGAVHQRTPAMRARVTAMVLVMEVDMMVILAARVALFVGATTARSLDTTIIGRMTAANNLLLLIPLFLKVFQHHLKLTTFT